MWIHFIPAWMRPPTPTILPMPTYKTYEVKVLPQKKVKKKYKVWVHGREEQFKIIKAVNGHKAILKFLKSSLERHDPLELEYELYHTKKYLKDRVNRLEQILKENNITLM